MSKTKKSLTSRAKEKLLPKWKGMLQTIKSEKDSKIGFILGCQRSGTTLLTKIFEEDINSKVFSEFDVINVPVRERKPTDPIYTTRLLEYDKVQQIFDDSPAGLIIAKPIVESQNADHILEAFEGAKVIWIYRGYSDVVSSNLKKFGPDNGIKNLRAIVESDESNWRAQRLDEDTRDMVKQHFAEDMNPYDAQALFWLVRNQWYFTLNLKDNENVLMVRYEDLVSKPSEITQEIYRHLDRTYPGDKLVASVHSTSIGKGSDISDKISEPIREMCRDMLSRLDGVYFSKRDTGN